MSQPARTHGRRLKSFRLCDVPEGVRFRALDKLLKTDGSPDGLLVASRSLQERVALGVAAHKPSQTVYWVSEDAWDAVMAPRKPVRRRTRSLEAVA